VVYGDERTPDRARLKEANDSSRTAAPTTRVFSSTAGGLAMRRLAIIDLSTGHQPLSYADETLWIVLTARSTTIASCAPSSKGAGHRFKTKSDTEVVLALYQEMGTRCVERLRGMFAFAVWDKKRRRLFIARDRIGKKPWSTRAPERRLDLRLRAA